MLHVWMLDNVHKAPSPPLPRIYRMYWIYSTQPLTLSFGWLPSNELSYIKAMHHLVRQKEFLRVDGWKTQNNFFYIIAIKEGGGGVKVVYH